MDNKQSSIEFLYNKMYEHRGNITIEEFEQAKAMHKSEIIWAHGIKMKGVNNLKCVSGEQYYNETFNK